MTRFQCDHIHLRSPEPEETARFYERMFGAKIIRTVQEGRERIDLDLGGQAIFIAPVLPDGKTAAPPRSPYQGLDHIGLTVRGIDAVAAALKDKGAEFTMEPTPIRRSEKVAEGKSVQIRVVL